MAPGVAERLDALSQHLFGDILAEVERNLTYALQEVLEQDLKVVSTTEVKKGKAPSASASSGTVTRKIFSPARAVPSATSSPWA